MTHSNEKDTSVTQNMLGNALDFIMAFGSGTDRIQSQAEATLFEVMLTSEVELFSNDVTKILSAARQMQVSGRVQNGRQEAIDAAAGLDMKKVEEIIGYLIKDSSFRSMTQPTAVKFGDYILKAIQDVRDMKPLVAVEVTEDQIAGMMFFAEQFSPDSKEGERAKAAVRDLLVSIGKLELTEDVSGPRP